VPRSGLAGARSRLLCSQSFQNFANILCSPSLALNKSGAQCAVAAARPRMWFADRPLPWRVLTLKEHGTMNRIVIASMLVLALITVVASWQRGCHGDNCAIANFVVPGL
jgi:hypothetical protein